LGCAHKQPQHMGPAVTYTGGLSPQTHHAEELVITNTSSCHTDKTPQGLRSFLWQTSITASCGFVCGKPTIGAGSQHQAGELQSNEGGRAARQQLSCARAESQTSSRQFNRVLRLKYRQDSLLLCCLQMLQQHCALPSLTALHTSYLPIGGGLAHARSKDTVAAENCRHVCVWRLVWQQKWASGAAIHENPGFHFNPA
jgi:hypothetical protein